MSNEKKQSFIGGVAILTAAVAIVKLIGAFYKLPLNNILGDVGKTYFQTAYDMYNLLLAISTAGLPLALSKLTSEAHAQGRENEKRRLFRTALCLFSILGLAGSGLMFFGSSQLAGFLNNPMASVPIFALSPAVFFVCMQSCMTGYIRGQGNMMPTAVSQVTEASCKMLLGLFLARYLLGKGLGLEYGAAGAIIGVTVGTALSTVFPLLYLLTHRRRVPALDVPSDSAVLAKKILAIGIPVTLSSSAMSIISIIDTKIILGRLQTGLGLTEQAASALKGQYSYAMDMLNMVASFVNPITLSLIPFVAAALVRKDYSGASRTISTAFRVIALLTFPAGIGLSVLATPIMRLVLPARPEGALAAGPHLRVLGIACIFTCLMILSNAILQTYGKERLPIFTMIAGGLVKITMNYILVGNPSVNIHGAPISTLCCYMVIVVLNLFFVWKFSPEKPQYIRLFAKPLAASLLMGGAVWAVYGFAERALAGGHSAYGANAAAALASILAGVAVYGVLVIALRILRAEDVKSIPHGEALVRLLRLK